MIFQESFKGFEGLLFVILGALAIAMPVLFTFSFELVIGALFVVGGLIQLFRSIKSFGAPGCLFWGLSSIVFIVLGYLLLANPLKGVLALTTIITICFLIDGCFKMLIAATMRLEQTWVWYMFLGIIEVILAVLIWNEWPSSALWVLGTLIGINLLFIGMTQVIISIQAKNYR